jgi:hypothetical protein
MATKKTKKKTRKWSPKKKAAPKQGRLNVIIDPGLKEWAHEFAERHHTNVTALITGYLVRLREAERDINVEQI